MNAKEYLLQARYLDERITSKTQQIASLNDLATRCTTTFSDMPRNPNRIPGAAFFLRSLRWKLPDP